MMRYDDILAFPLFMDVSPAYRQAQHGMTLRDWFAGQVVCGLWGRGNLGVERFEETAKDAYGFADALLEARK